MRKSNDLNGYYIDCMEAVLKVMLCFMVKSVWRLSVVFLWKKRGKSNYQTISILILSYSSVLHAHVFNYHEFTSHLW